MQLQSIKLQMGGACALKIDCTCTYSIIVTKPARASTVLLGRVSHKGQQAEEKDQYYRLEVAIDQF